MSIEQLQKILPVPNRRRTNERWDEIEEKVNYKLPEDYKSFIEIYGTFNIDDFLWIYNPFAKNKYLNLIYKTKTFVEVLRDLMNDFEDAVPFGYPDTHDLILWSGTDNGDFIYWLINKEESKWKIVVNESRTFNWQEFDMTTTEFIYKLLTKQIKVDAFPDDFPKIGDRGVQTRNLSC